MTNLLCVARCRPKPAGPREAAPGYRLCWVDLSLIRERLRELHDLADDLEAALSRSGSIAEKVSGTPGRTLELDVRAAAVRFDIHNGLVTTVRLVIEERGHTDWPRDSIGSMTHWLDKHVEWIAAHPSAGERADQINSWPGRARSAIHPNPAKHVKIGPCVKDDCPGMLSAIVKPQDSMLPSAIVCSWWTELEDKTDVEPHEWSADQWHYLGRLMQRRTA